MENCYGLRKVYVCDGERCIYLSVCKIKNFMMWGLNYY